MACQVLLLSKIAPWLSVSMRTRGTNHLQSGQMLSYVWRCPFLSSFITRLWMPCWYLTQDASWIRTSSLFPLSSFRSLLMNHSLRYQLALKLPNQKSSWTSLIPSLFCSRFHLHLFLRSCSCQHDKLASSSPPTEVFQSGWSPLSGKHMQTWNTSSL